MRRFENEIFDGLHNAESGATYTDLEFRKCTFLSCFLSATRGPAHRPTVRNVRLFNCSETTCALYDAIIEDVVVDGLTTRGDLLIADGVVFKHTALRGKIGRIMVTSPEAQEFYDANAAYYREVDWALDISQGEFRELELRGVPARLVARDRETQVIVTRESVLPQTWRKLEFESPVTAIALRCFLDRGEADMVLVAAKRDPDFAASLADLELLRKARIAEPG
jgi:hypothetical protein